MGPGGEDGGTTARASAGPSGGVRLAGALALVVACAAVLPAARARHLRPGEPASVATLYRHRAGDVQYFPLVAALARGEVREFTVREAAGTGILSFPVASLAVHAACWRAFGPATGTLLADAAVAVAYFLLLAMLLRAAGVAPGWAAGLALGPACHLTPALTVGLGEATLPLVAGLWGERFPRPFVSEVFVLAALVLLARLWARRAEAGPATWGALGLTLALVVQSDIYPAVPLAGASALAWLGSLRRSAGGAARGALAAGSAFALALIPFALQRLGEHPDVPARFGVFPVDRRHPPFDIQEPLHALPYLGVLALVAGATWAWRSEVDADRGAGEARAQLRVWLLLGVIVALAHLAMPISAAALGRAIQVFQFPIRSRMFRSYAVFLALGWVVERAGRATLGRPRLPRLEVATAVALVAGGVLALTWRRGAGSDGPLRPEVYPAVDPAGAGPYRAEFADLARHLEGAARGRRPVLGTLDPQIYSWWLSFTDGYSFLAEAFVSTASDRTVERRLAALGRRLGATPDDYMALIRERGTLWFWLGSVKYQASRAYHLAPEVEYDPATRREIREGSLYNNFNVALPAGEAERLRRDYVGPESPEVEQARLDVIVLTTGGPLGHLAPPAADWRPTFRSPRFRVYERNR